MVDHVFRLVPVPNKLDEFLRLRGLPVINADAVKALDTAGLSVFDGDFFSREEEDTDDLIVWLRSVLHDKEVTEGVFLTLVTADTLEKDGKEVLSLPINLKVRWVFVC